MNVVVMILEIVSGYYNLSVFVYILGLEDKMPGFCINGLEFFIYWKKKKKAPKFLSREHFPCIFSSISLTEFLFSVNWK